MVRPEPYDYSRKLICGLLALGRNSGTAVLLELAPQTAFPSAFFKKGPGRNGVTGQSSRFSGMMLLIAAAFTKIFGCDRRPTRAPHFV